jgi:carbonic anhydrase
MVEQKHTCESIVVACIDFRFQNFLREWLDDNLDKGYDYVGFAGSTKELETVMNQVDISVRLHNIKQAHLIHHEDCGAYGTESTFERHTQDLKKAKAEILEKHSDLRVSLYYLRLDGTFENID